MENNNNTTTIGNLETVLKLNVNMFEIENAILNGESSYKTHDFEFFFIELPTRKLSAYNTQENEVIIHTNEETSILVKKI